MTLLDLAVAQTTAQAKGVTLLPEHVEMAIKTVPDYAPPVENVQVITGEDFENPPADTNKEPERDLRDLLKDLLQSPFFGMLGPGGIMFADYFDIGSGQSEFLTGGFDVSKVVAPGMFGMVGMAASDITNTGYFQTEKVGEYSSHVIKETVKSNILPDIDFKAVALWGGALVGGLILLAYLLKKKK